MSARRVGDWTQFEDLRLQAAHDLRLPWKQIAAQYLPGRTVHACVTRYRYLEAGKPPKTRRSRLETLPPVIPPAEPETLPDAIKRLYRVEARRRGTTPEVVSLILNYSPAELQRMHARAAA